MPGRLGRTTKRALDIGISVGLLLLLAPAFLTIAVAVRINLGRPVLFRQVRPGRDGQPFVLLKFRSMTEERDETGRLAADAIRLTRFGAWLRATSLDELPELWNVLRGDMSLVGPRPLLMEYLPLYTRDQARRHDVRPGITGWTQVNGRNACSWDEKLERDVWYVDNWSLALDLRILVRTIREVLLRRGITSPGHATTDRLTDRVGTDRTTTSKGDEIGTSPAGRKDSPSR